MSTLSIAKSFSKNRRLALLLGFGLAMVACKSEISTVPNSKQRGKESQNAFQLTGRQPLVVGPGTVVTLIGVNIRPTLTVAIAGESRTPLEVAVASDGSASFVTPADLPAGPLKLVATQDGLEQPLSLYFDLGKADYPIFTGDASLFPSGQKFYDANGLLQKGTKPLCTKDGQVNCETSDAFKAFSTANLTAGNIKSGVTIGGVTGSLATAANAPNCSSDGGINCVVDGTSYKVVSAANLSASNIKSGVTLGGVVGSYAATASSLPNCTSDGASQCVVDGTTYKAASIAALSAGNIKFGVTIGGVVGSLPTASNAPNCNADGGVGCVVDGTIYKAAKLSNFTAADFKVGISIAGVAGSLSTCSADGAGSCLVDGTTYKAAKLANFAASDVKSGITVAGVGGTLGNCALNGSNCFLPSYVQTAQPLRAISYDAIDASKMLTTLSLGGVTGTVNLSNLVASNIKDSVVVGGVTGTYGPACSLDGASSCLVDGTNYKAAKLTNFSGSDFRSGVTIAGVSGSLANCSASGATGCMVVGPTYKAATDCAADGAGSCFVDGATYKALKPASISASGMLSSVTLLGVTGSIANCASDGSSACYVPSYVLTTQPYRAVNYDNINSNIAKLRTGVTVAGLTGTLADCSSNNVTGCVTTATFKSADLTNLAAANIRRGVAIAGTTGTFPSSTAPLPLWTDGSTTATTTSTGEVDFTNFITQLTSAGTFQYWDSTGQRRTGSGDANIVAANVKTGVTFANVNVTGSFQGTAPSAWDVRAGVTVGGVAGKLKINCRNSINNSYYNWDGAVSSLTDTASTSGTTFDYWDTIDDYYGQPSSTGFPAAWSVANNYCGGTTTTATDDNVWLDTTIGTCATNGSNCRYKDKISGLEWSKHTGATTYTWSQAVRYCTNLTHDGQTGWRLPTQKELQAAYTHGIVSLAGTNWVTLAQMLGYVWSASTLANSTPYAWIVALATGLVTNTTKPNSFPAVCVR